VDAIIDTELLVAPIDDELGGATRQNPFPETSRLVVVTEPKVFNEVKES